MAGRQSPHKWITVVHTLTAREWVVLTKGRPPSFLFLYHLTYLSVICHEVLGRV